MFFLRVQGSAAEPGHKGAAILVLDAHRARKTQFEVIRVN